VELSEETEDTGHWILKKLRSIRRGAEEFQPDIRPRLVVITKLQDPFNFYGLARYYESFRDDSDYLYLYISTRCPMTDIDRDRSLESWIRLLRFASRLPRDHLQTKKILSRLLKI
jgi:hypothetical protein